MLRLPNAPQRGLGVAVDEPLLVVHEERRQRLGQHDHIRHGQVHALRAGRRHGVRGIAHERHPAVPQLTRHETAEAQHITLEDAALLQRRAGYASLQGLPDLALARCGRIRLRVALEIHPLHLGRALADQGEPVGRGAVDEFVRARRGLAEDPEPRERVLAEIAAGRGPTDRGADDRARSVGADHEVGLDLEVDALGVRAEHPWPIGRGVLHPQRGRSEPEILSVRDPQREQILQHLVLRVQPDAAPD